MPSSNTLKHRRWLIDISEENILATLKHKEPIHSEYHATIKNFGVDKTFPVITTSLVLPNGQQYVASYSPIGTINIFTLKYENVLVPINQDKSRLTRVLCCTRRHTSNVTHTPKYYRPVVEHMLQLFNEHAQK